MWQAIGHCSSTPFNKACRAKHRVTTTRSTWETSLSLDHQSGCSRGGRPSLREDLRVPIRGLHQRVSKSNTCTGAEGHCSVPVPPFWGVTGQSGTTPRHAGDQKNGDGGSQTRALPDTKNLEEWRRSSPISTKVNEPTSKTQT